MKTQHFFYITCLFLFFQITAFCQEDSLNLKKGKIYGDLFLNANYNLEKNTASFRLNRLHFGYNYNISPNYYVNGMIESAKEDYVPATDSAGGEYNNITNLFEFCFGFQFSKLEGKIGLIGTELNQQQEANWKHRLIDKIFADKYGLAPTNDFGALLKYRASENLTLDLALTNGEGHKSLQADSAFRYAFGVTFAMNNVLNARIYVDYIDFSSDGQTNLIALFGYNSEIVSFGGEWNHQFNSNGISDSQRFGYSVYLDVALNSKNTFFARYDNIEAQKPSKTTIENEPGWEGQTYILGAQHKINKNILFALDYRAWAPSQGGEDRVSLIFFNIGINF